MGLSAPATAYPLGHADIEQTLELVTHQRGIRPFAGDALLVDGQLYSHLLPPELRDLAMPPRHGWAQLRRAYEKKFNLRSGWRFVRHAKADKDVSRGGGARYVPGVFGASVPLDDASFA